ncbi:MAG: chemotaxis protein CheW [Isosphaeraceae bacterium]|nr:chemotaxis protein CheW [Isosphaeraceae bacterium]
MSAELVVAHDCWNRIGVSGDHSCPELLQFIHCRNCPVFASAARAFFDRPAPDGYLAGWASLLGGEQESATNDADSVSLLLFRLHADWLALSLRAVVEVTAVRPVHRIPHRTDAVLAGLVNLRGQLHLRVSLHGLLDVAPAADPGPHGATARMIVIRQGTELWVFAADEVLGVHRVSRAALRAAPSTLADPAISFSQAVFAWEGRSVGYLDEQRVFAALRRVGQ